MSTPATTNSAYLAPVLDMIDSLDVAGFESLLELAEFVHVDHEVTRSVLAEFAKLAANVIAPTNRVGDATGARFDPATGCVAIPESFVPAYEQYKAGGWGGLQFPTDIGGGGFPYVVGLCMQEILAGANMALSLNVVLSQGAVELLLGWGSPDQQRRYLPKLLSGEWSGTMNLTETNAGSDLGAIATLASPWGDDSWRIRGTKIFITWGEHNLTENIVHLVLARTPDSAPGTRGLSLFVVPKYLVSSDGHQGEPNALRCLRIEDKLGIHASPTCVMEFDDAVGELVGPLHGGMRAMFTMMNVARLAIATEGPGIGERAYQLAHSYARERLQGRSAARDDVAPSPIADYPDVQRMLLAMRTQTEASRLLIYFAGVNRDLARLAPSPKMRQVAQARVDLVTPIAKSWATDDGFTSASLGIQVLGGAGFIEESGMAQHLRDVRIASIYEGTNGIQAIDLLTRKIGRDGGVAMSGLIKQIASGLDRSALKPELELAAKLAKKAARSLEQATSWMLAHVHDAPRDALVGANAYLELAALCIGGWLMIERADRRLGTDRISADQVVGEALFFATEFVTKADGLASTIISGASRLGGI